MTAHDPALLAALAKIDTPTICNALEELVTTGRVVRLADASVPTAGLRRAH